jgi:hypothetical protein
MRLRLKILSGFLILAVMLSIAGAWSIYELVSTSASVEAMLDDNYRSISAARVMLDALEREDSGILLLLLGRRSDGRRIVASADSLFRSVFEVAASNVTIPGERAYVDSIGAAYERYKALWEPPIVGTRNEGDLNWYFESVHDAFLAVTGAVGELMSLNDRVLFETASGLEQRARRAIMPGIVAIVAAVLFSLMFSYFINVYVVGPIARITDGVAAFVRNREPFDVTLETRDELADLANAIRTLIAVARESRSAP